MSNIQNYIDYIISQRDQTQPLYLLVDPLKNIWDHYLISLPSLKERLGEESVAVVPRLDLLHEPTRSPHLIQLVEADEPFTEELLEILSYSLDYSLKEHIGSRRYVYGWLQSPLALEELAQNIADKMLFTADPTSSLPIYNPNSPTGNSNTKLHPIYEPLRQELISLASHQDEVDTHHAWLLPITWWLIPTANQTFMQLTGAQGTPNALSPNAIQAQLNTPVVADVLSVWYRYTKEELSHNQLQQLPLLQQGANAIPKGAAYQALAYLRLAQKKGLTDRADQITFALMRLLSHPKFDEHPIIKNHITQTLQGHGQYSDLIAQIESPQWLTILAELNSGDYLYRVHAQGGEY